MFYRNKKNGGTYQVIGVAINAANSANGEAVVIYQPVGVLDPVTYVCERVEFDEKFESISETNYGGCPHKNLRFIGQKLSKNFERYQCQDCDEEISVLIERR